jgi:hypothetical protein
MEIAGLNRSVLARQWLDTAKPGKPMEAIEQLVGLQAQAPSPPYFGLWARLKDFQPEARMALRGEKQVYRAPLLRPTLHWVSAADYYWIRPTIQPALERAWQGFFGKRKDGIEVAPLCAAARELPRGGPIPWGDLSTGLPRELPQWNGEAMEYGVRTHLPLVQVSPAGRVLATVLLGGVVGEVWRLERGRGVETLRVELFAEPPARRRKQVAAEAERLLAWAEPQCARREIALTW